VANALLEGTEQKEASVVSYSLVWVTAQVTCPCVARPRWHTLQLTWGHRSRISSNTTLSLGRHARRPGFILSCPPRRVPAATVSLRRLASSVATISSSMRSQFRRGRASRRKDTPSEWVWIFHRCRPGQVDFLPSMLLQGSCKLMGGEEDGPTTLS